MSITVKAGTMLSTDRQAPIGGISKSTPRTFLLFDPLMRSNTMKTTTLNRYRWCLCTHNRNNVEHQNGRTPPHYALDHRSRRCSYIRCLYGANGQAPMTSERGPRVDPAAPANSFISSMRIYGWGRILLPLLHMHTFAASFAGKRL